MAITAYWQGEERRTEDLCKRALSFSVKWGANESEELDSFQRDRTGVIKELVKMQ